MKWIVRVNTAEGTIKKESVPEEYKLLGGKSLIARIMNDEVDPTCEPLGPGNKFIVSPGILGGTPAPSSGRISVGGKSPLTGGIKEANAGGTIAHRLARLGIKAIIFENVPAEPSLKLLVIKPDSISLEPAESYAGMGNYELNEKLRATYGDKVSIMSAGPAGERGYPNSSVAISDTNGRPTRQAARGGMGAVMASKGIKAIIVEDPGPVKLEMADRKAFQNAAKGLSKALLENPIAGGGLPALGTASLVSLVNGMGALPTNNFSVGVFEGSENICGERIAELQKTREGANGHPCHPGCVIRCSNIYNDASGNYITSGMEYETISLIGSNCGISDPDVIAKLDRTCDDFGLDTMDTGTTIAVAMEVGLAKFGDAESQMKLVEEIVKDTHLGKILAQGTGAAGRILGAKRIPAVKGQGLAGYDPRGLKGTGVTQATSPMGADHTCGNTLGQPLDPLNKEGQLELSKNLQFVTATMDSLGLCIFVCFCFEKPENLQYLADMVNARYGTSLDVNGVIGIGAQCVQLEREFNKRAGITEANGKMPDFMSKEPLPPHNKVFDFTLSELQAIWE